VKTGETAFRKKVNASKSVRLRLGRGLKKIRAKVAFRQVNVGHWSKVHPGAECFLHSIPVDTFCALLGVEILTEEKMSGITNQDVFHSNEFVFYQKSPIFVKI
jgi:hypothetical protein